MEIDCPYFSLKQTLKRIIARGKQSDIIVYRTDIPGYFERGTHVIVTHNGGVFSGRKPMFWKSELRYFSIPEGKYEDCLDGRIMIDFPKPVIGEDALTDMHLNLKDAGVRAPLYFRGNDPENYLAKRTFTKVSFYGDADAVIAAGLLATI